MCSIGSEKKIRREERGQIWFWKKRNPLRNRREEKQKHPGHMVRLKKEMQEWEETNTVTHYTNLSLSQKSKKPFDLRRIRREEQGAPPVDGEKKSRSIGQ